jgi:hypothetical protein
MVHKFLRTWPRAIAAVCCFALPTAAGEGPAPTSSPPSSDTDLQPVIRQLEAAEFAERQAASQKLAEAGTAAFPELEKAAESKSREVSGRALDILKQHFQGPHNELKQAAAETLQRLAKSENRSTAQRADRVLSPPKEPEAIVLNPANLQGIQFNAQIQLGGFGGQIAGGNFRRISRREANGKRDVEVEENGRKIHLQTFPGGNIEVEVTDNQNGRNVTRKVEAKDVDDLKRKDAAAGALYELYDAAPQPAARPRPAPQPRPGEQFLPFPAPAPAEIERRLVPPAGFPNRAPFGAERDAPLPQGIDARQRAVQTLERQIEQLKAQRPDNPATQRMVEMLEQHKQRLEDALRR